MNKFLKNLKILVTRPRKQANALIDTITAAGGIPYLFHTMEITGYESADFLEQLKSIKNKDILIYISANAVHYSENFWQGTKPDVITIAIGPGTACALNQYNQSIHYLPEQYNSEGLLALPVLQNIKNASVFIFCGDNTNPYLSTQLRQRGANVHLMSCYQRNFPAIDENKLKALALEKINIALSTSLENLQNFVKIAKLASNHHWLLELPLVVINDKMVKCAQQAGIKKIIVAENATDEAIISALKKYQTS